VCDAPYRDAEAGSLQVTVSIGAAYCSAHMDTSVSRLLERADRALYEAKQTGRNRVFWLAP